MLLMDMHSKFRTKICTEEEILTHGFRYYCLSILDKHHHPDIDYEQGMKILRMCTDELKRRLPIDFKGVCELPILTSLFSQ